MKAKTNFLLSGILFALFIIFTLLVLNFDVQSIGPEGSFVGFAELNSFFRGAVGVNMLWYNITDWLGISAIFTAFDFALLGLFQVIRRKSLLKVDADIYILGGLYLLVITAYVFFEINVINYRPVLMDGMLEASYPSSHVMMVCTVMGSAVLQFRSRIKRKKLLFTANSISLAVIIVTVFGRFLSGVHWTSDIIGALLLSGALLMLYHSCVSLINNKK